MIFKNFSLNFWNHVQFFELFKELVKDRRLRHWKIAFATALTLLITLNIIEHIHKNRLEKSILSLKHHTNELAYRLETTKQQALIPKIEKSIKAVGAYNQLLTEEDCMSNINGCLLQKNKPQFKITASTLIPHSTHSISSFDIGFKSSFDYEIFDMMGYVLSTHTKFGYTRLRSFEIEQLFETSPAVKGRFVYDQLSLTP